MHVANKSTRFCAECGSVFTLEEGKQVPENVPLYALNRMAELGLITLEQKEKKTVAALRGVWKKGEPPQTDLN